MCCQANDKAHSLGALAALERIQLQFPAPKLDSAQLPVTAAKGDQKPYSGLLGYCTWAQIYLHKK